MDIVTKLYTFYEWFPGPIQFLMSLFLVHIVAKGLLARDIMTLIDERGWFRDGLVHGIIRSLKNRWLDWWHQPRNEILQEHVYKGHVQNITSCNQDACATI